MHNVHNIFFYIYSLKHIMAKNYKRSFVKILMLGFTLGLFIATLFIYSVPFPKFSWGPNWMVKPLILVSLISAIGSIPFYYANQYDAPHPKNKILTYILSAVVLIICIWIGVVLGFKGTLWD